MKKSAALCLLAFVLGANTGCEQQSYEETKMFNQSSKAAAHGAGHGKAAEHKAEGAAHPEAPAAGHGDK